MFKQLNEQFNFKFSLPIIKTQSRKYFKRLKSLILKLIITRKGIIIGTNLYQVHEVTKTPEKERNRSLMSPTSSQGRSTPTRPSSKQQDHLRKILGRGTPTKKQPKPEVFEAEVIEVIDEQVRDPVLETGSSIVSGTTQEDEESDEEEVSSFLILVSAEKHFV